MPAPKEELAPMTGAVFECQCLQVPEFAVHQAYVPDNQSPEFLPLPGWAPLFPQPNL